MMLSFQNALCLTRFPAVLKVSPALDVGQDAQDVEVLSLHGMVPPRCGTVLAQWGQYSPHVGQPLLDRPILTYVVW